MNAASENLEFEKAAKLRDTINAIRKIGDKQKVVAASVPEQDVFSIVGAADGASPKSCLSVLRFRDRRLFDSEHFIIDYQEDLPSARHELIRSYYSMRDKYLQEYPWTAKWRTRNFFPTGSLPLREEK